MSAPSSRPLLGSYGPWIDALTSGSAREYSFLAGRWKEVSGWRAEARKVLASRILSQELGLPEVEVRARRSFDGIVAEELAWKLPYGPETRACFLKPAGAKGRLPGILALHDHGANKHFGYRKIADATSEVHPHVANYRRLYYGGKAWANELARRGYAVLVHDVFPFGNRAIRPSDLPPLVVERMMLDPRDLRELSPETMAEHRQDQAYDVLPDEPSADIDRYNAFAGQYESTIAKALFCAGLTWPGVVLSEDRVALDYLASRPDVDPERLGCGGLSGGGLRANFLAGTDDRIRCSSTTGFMTTWADFAMRTAYTHTWMIYVPGLPPLMDYPDILALRAPLPALVQATRQDPLFTPAEVEKAMAALEGTWRKAGAAEKLKTSWYEGPHRFDLEMQEEAFGWFGRWLGG